MDTALANIFVISIFTIGYVFIILEHYLKVSKSAVALLIAVLCWMFYFINDTGSVAISIKELGHHMSDISQILFFLLGAMTLVEIIDSHKGFNLVIKLINTRNKRKVLLIISLLSFFLSSVLDNLTTTILMVSILRKLVPFKKERLTLACMVVIAANAGGAWTPIGDVTTTMLWINGQVSTMAVIKELIIPSLICMIVPLVIYMIPAKGEYSLSEIDYQYERGEPGAGIVFTVGILGLIGVPLFKWATGMPPFMGMIIALAVLWLVTDILHHRYEHRQHLRVPSILTKIDVSSILFFLGILLAVDALDVTKFLDQVAIFLDTHVHNVTEIATAIGIFSAIVDNVPLVAATMGMYDLATYPMDSQLWLLIAYAAGTGGSILIIGSSAGVALMGIEKVDFIAYMKRASLPALAGYLAGILFYVMVMSV